jgi:hypothetical protein
MECIRLTWEYEKQVSVASDRAPGLAKDPATFERGANGAAASERAPVSRQKLKMEDAVGMYRMSSQRRKNEEVARNI